MGVKPRLSMTSRSALFFTKISVAWAWAAPDFYAVGELHINAFYTNSTTFVCFNYGLNIELLHTKKAGIFTCSDRDHNSEKNYTTATLSTLFPPSTWPLPMRGESFGHWPTESNFFFLQQKRLDSASQCPNDSPRTLPSKETHTSVWEKTLGFSNERTFVFFDKFSTTRGWLVSMIVGTVRSISKS